MHEINITSQKRKKDLEEQMKPEKLKEVFEKRLSKVKSIAHTYSNVENKGAVIWDFSRKKSLIRDT